MAFYYRIRLSGGADVDLALASKILAEALAIYEDKNVVQHISYGPEARGATARADLVVADGEIRWPKAETLDLLAALSQEAADTYAAAVKEGGIILIDRDAVPKPPQGAFRLYVLPLYEDARALGNARLTHIVTLGAVTALSSVHHRRAVEDALLARVPPGTEKIHVAAFERGWNGIQAVM